MSSEMSGESVVSRLSTLVDSGVSRMSVVSVSSPWMIGRVGSDMSVDSEATGSSSDTSDSGGFSAAEVRSSDFSAVESVCLVGAGNAPLCCSFRKAFTVKLIRTPRSGLRTNQLRGRCGANSICADG